MGGSLQCRELPSSARGERSASASSVSRIGDTAQTLSGARPAHVPGEAS
jgi:hypothetical protein